MDEIDYAIIRALQADGRMSWTELGKTVGLSTPAVNERVKKLEDRGDHRRIPSRYQSRCARQNHHGNFDVRRYAV